jgi:hypothetical protein
MLIADQQLLAKFNDVMSNPQEVVAKKAVFKRGGCTI